MMLNGSYGKWQLRFASGTHRDRVTFDMHPGRHGTHMAEGRTEAQSAARHSEGLTFFLLLSTNTKYFS